MNYLKRIMMFMVLVLLLQGCAFYARGGHGEYHERYPYYHRYYHYGYWR